MCKGFWLLLLTFVLFPAACEPANPSLVAVHGTIRFHGELLRQGVVVFTPDPLRGNSGPVASAAIQSDGSYVLRSSEQPGAVAGWHRVTVIAVESVRDFNSPDGRSVPRSLIPEKYNDPEQSGLYCEVKADTNNVIDFDLD